MDVRPDPLDKGSAADTAGMLSFFRCAVAAGLVLTGVFLGLYIAFTALGLVNGKEPPALVKNLVQDAVQGAVKQVENENKLDFEVSSNVLAAVGWLLTFLFLLIPTTVAGGLIRGGAGLLQPESTQVLQQIVDRLRRAQK